MKKLFLILALFLAVNTGFSEKQTIVVMNFDTTGVDKEIGVAISEMYRVYLQSLSTNYKVIERARLNEILKEQKLQLSGALGDNEDFEVGNLLSADYIILGSINTIGDLIIIQSRIVNSSSGEIVTAGMTQSQGLSQLPDKTKELVFIILGQKKTQADPVAGSDIPDTPQLVDKQVKKRYTFSSWYSDAGGKHQGGKIILEVIGDTVTGTSVESYGKAVMNASIQGDKVVGFYKASYGHGNFTFQIGRKWKSLTGTYYQISNGAQGEWSGTLDKVETLE